MTANFSRTAKLATFAVALVGLFAVGAAAGKLIEPDVSSEDASGHGDGAHGEAGADPVRGLAVAEHGLRLQIEDPELSRGETAELRFRVLDPGGAAVRAFDVEHTKRMHTIVVRRDLSGFQHLHPELAADGTWSVPLRLDEAGSYRVFADFSQAGEATTLAGDLRVDGDADLRPLPAPAPRALSDGGFDVRLRGGHAHSGETASLEFEVTEDGRPVPLQPYLGAGGHLVALRDGDLAFLHVHPEDDPAAARAGQASFMASFPSAGSYRLFLQFQVDGKVHTAAFTEEVR